MFGDPLDLLRNVLNAVRARLWLIPGVMSVLAAVLARLVVRLEDSWLVGDIDAWWYFGGNAGTARDLLFTLLSGMITMSSLVISITMVVLSVATNQLGPRLIWNFIRDRQIQFVIGLFFGTIIFILVVERSVRAEVVPAVAVTAASAFVVVCLFALLFYIHKIARSIIADTVITQVAAELVATIRALPGEPKPSDGGEPPAGTRSSVLSVQRSGYVQVIQYNGLARIAERHDICIKVRVRAGHFLLRGGEYVEIFHREPLDQQCADSIRKAFVMGSQRTPTQDVEYSVRQLVEIAVRAMSPGINDPFTAITVAHRLGEALEVLMTKFLPEQVSIADDQGVTRVLGAADTFQGIVDASFNQVRQAATSNSNAALLISLCVLLGQLATASKTPAQRKVIGDHIEMVARAAERVIQERHDMMDFEAAHTEAVRSLVPAT